jgi:transposase
MQYLNKLLNANKYIFRSRISEAKFRQVIKLFFLYLNATQIAELTGLSRNTVNSHLMLIRTQIAEYCQDQFLFSVKASPN